MSWICLPLENSEATWKKATKCNKNTLFGKYQTSGYYKIRLKPCLGKTENSHPKEVLKTLLFPSSKYIELGSRPKALLMSKIRLETWHTPFTLLVQNFRQQKNQPLLIQRSRPLRDSQEPKTTKKIQFSQSIFQKIPFLYFFLHKSWI